MRQPLKIMACLIAMAAGFYFSDHRRHATYPAKAGWMLLTPGNK